MGDGKSGGAAGGGAGQSLAFFLVTAATASFTLIGCSCTPIIDGKKKPWKPCQNYLGCHNSNRTRGSKVELSE